jgi:hypothetical protein
MISSNILQCHDFTAFTNLNPIVSTIKMQEKGVWPFTTPCVLEDRKKHLLELATGSIRIRTSSIANTMKQTRGGAQSASKGDGVIYA